MDSTILIIGAGTFGVSTAWHLSQNHSDPSKVIIIDREASPPSRSAAVEINRILTADYASPMYAELAGEAMSFWAEDPDLEWYFHKAGRLVLEEKGHHDGQRAPQPRGRGDLQELDLAEVKRRWNVLDGTDLRAVHRAYLEPDAGWVDAATATWQFLETAIRRRVRRVVGDVAELVFDKTDGGIRGARTADGREFLADTVVLAAGAWTSALLAPVEDALNISDEDRIEVQAQATATISVSYPVTTEGLKQIAGCKMPCVVYGEVGEVVPASRDEKLLRYTGLKTKVVNMMTTRSGRQISVPPEKWGSRVPEDLKINIEKTVTQLLMPKFAKGRPDWRMCCMFSPLYNLRGHSLLQHLSVILIYSRGQLLTDGGSLALQASANHKSLYNYRWKFPRLQVRTLDPDGASL